MEKGTRRAQQRRGMRELKRRKKWRRRKYHEKIERRKPAKMPKMVIERKEDTLWERLKNRIKEIINKGRDKIKKYHGTNTT